MTGCDLTRRAQTALRLARESSAQLGHGYVGSEHLLLGLLEERRGAAARALQAAGIQESAVREAIAGLVGVGARGCGPSQGLTPRCRRIVELAALESNRLGSRFVDTEHLLIGILRDGDGSAARILGGYRRRSAQAVPGTLRLSGGPQRLRPLPKPCQGL